MTKDEIKEELAEIAHDYAIDAENTCVQIDGLMRSEGFSLGGGEMRRCQRWERGDEIVYIDYDPERNTIGIS